MGIKIEIPPGAQDVFPKVTARVGLCDSSVHNFDQITVFSANEDITLIRSNGPTRDQHPLSQLMGIVFHQQPILASAGLALVRVTDHVSRLTGGARHKAPFHAGRESRTTPAS